MEIVLIELSKIKPNEYNPNVVSGDILAKLRAEIGQKGLCEPIIVRSSGNGYIIVDGEHRWQVCRELGFKDIPCIVQDYTVRIPPYRDHLFRSSVTTYSGQP